MNSVNRRQFLTQLSLTTAGLAISKDILFSRPTFSEEFVEADTSYGRIKGFRTGRVTNGCCDVKYSYKKNKNECQRRRFPTRCVLSMTPQTPLVMSCILHAQRCIFLE
jgi:hypothetical protein